MTTEDFTIELFYRVDRELPDVAKHSQAKLYPSEVITLAFLFALKGVGNRALLSLAGTRLEASVPQLAVAHSPFSPVPLASPFD